QNFFQVLIQKIYILFSVIYLNPSILIIYDNTVIFKRNQLFTILVKQSVVYHDFIFIMNHCLSGTNIDWICICQKNTVIFQRENHFPIFSDDTFFFILFDNF